MRVRDPGLLALSLLLLAGSGGLGLLVHDGTLGVDVDAALAADDGDWIRLKGDLHPLGTMDARASDAFLTYTVRLDGTGVEAAVYLTSDDPLPSDGTVVVTGQVIQRGADPAVLVLQADEMDAPYVFQ